MLYFWRHVGSDAHDDAGNGFVAGDGVDHGLLFGRVVHDRPDASEQRLEDRQADRLVAFRGRHENRPSACRARSVKGVVVAVAEEQAVVVISGVLLDVIDERRARRPFRIEPVELVAQRVPLLEHAIGALAEHQRIAFVLHLEAAYLHAVDLLHAGLQLVAPRDVVGGARREHFDLAVTREMFGDVARVQLRATVDRVTVALNDDRDLHCGS